MSDRSPTLAGVVNKAIEAAMRRTNVMRPGRVERVDLTTQLLDVQPLVGEVYEAEDGTITHEHLPLITNVAYACMAGGGLRMTFPVSVGDTVMLVFADRSIDAWQATGIKSLPEDQRRHHFSDAIAVPCIHPNTQPWTGVEATCITIGSDVGLADYVALASKVEALINALKTVFAAWAPVPGDGGAVLKTALATMLSVPPWNSVSVGSTTVKIKG